MEQMLSLNTSPLFPNTADAGTPNTPRTPEDARGLALWEHTGTLLWTLPADGVIHAPDASWLAYTGQRPEEARGSGWLEGVFPQDQQPLLQAITHAEAAGTSFEATCRFRRYDGAYRTFRIQGAPAWATNGTLSEWVCCCTDNAKQQTEGQAPLAKAPHACTSEAEAMLEAMLDGVLVYNQEGHIIQSNQTMHTSIAVQTDPDFPALPLEDRLRRLHIRNAQGELLPLDQTLQLRLLRGETIRIGESEEFQVRSLDGHELVFTVAGAPLRDVTGAISGAVLVARDVTEQRRLEAEREATTRLFEATFEQAAVGMAHIGLDGRFLRFNTRICEITGYRREDLAALSFQAITHPDDLGADLDYVRQLLAGEITTFTMDKRYLRPDGSTVWAQLTASLLRTSAGEPECFISVVEDISARKATEAALVASEAQLQQSVAWLQAVLEAMTDGVLVVDQEGYIVRSNQALDTITSIQADPAYRSLLLEEWLRRLHIRNAQGERLPLDQSPQLRLMRGEIIHMGEAEDIQVRTLDGRDIMLNVTGAPLQDATGIVTGAVMVFREVTRRRKLEHEITERAILLETLLESITDGIAVIDPQGRLVRTNHALRALFGLDQHPDYAGRPLAERVAGYAVRKAQGEPLPVEEWPALRLLQGEVLTGMDRRITNLEGREFVLNIGGAPLRDAQGHITGCVEVFRDITERQQLEQRTRDALNALMTMAETMVQMQPTTDSLVGADQVPSLPLQALALPTVAKRLARLTQSVLGCRRVSLAAVDTSTGQLAPITVVGLTPLQEEDWWASWSSGQTLQDRFGASVAAALRVGEPVLLESSQVPECYRYTLFHAQTGQLLPMCIGEELVGVLFVDYVEPRQGASAPGEVPLTETIARLGALVLDRDRLLHRWMEARASALALLETKAQMDTFLGIASHELKTPLASLKLGLQLTERHLRTLARRQVESRSDGERPLELIVEDLTLPRQQLERMERLVNDLVDASRIQAGKLDLRLELTDLVPLVQQVVEAQRQATPERTISLTLPEEQPVLVLADPGRIEQVITNYLTNALKYSSAESLVAVGVQVAEQQARVWVRDAGPGLPTQEQERIWERFHRVKGIEVQSGTGVGLGLGLHICRTIVERHQGQVGVESAPGEGSTFWFTLPMSSPPEKGLSWPLTS